MLDKVEFDFQCPICSFYNSALVEQARLRDMIICRGCKSNIQLDDHMNECRLAVRRLNKILNDFGESLKNLNLTIKI